MGTQLALDGGASEESFEAWNEDMIANENVPEDFDWRDHVDFSLPHRGAGGARPPGRARRHRRPQRRSGTGVTVGAGPSAVVCAHRRTREIR